MRVYTVKADKRLEEGWRVGKGASMGLVEHVYSVNGFQ